MASLKKIDELTPEQDVAADELAARYEHVVLSGDDAYDVAAIRDGIDFVYGLADLPSPDIVICPSPLDMAVAAKIKKGETIDYFGQGYDVGWTAFYDFMHTTLGIPYDPEWGFDRWRAFIMNSGVFATVLREHVAFVCIRPCLVARDAAGSLHCETGPAIAWRDGYEEYFLHGVAVDRELVMTPGEDLDPHTWVLKQANAEVRREAVRKIGIERVCERLGAKVIDRQGEMYELLELDLGDGRRRPYLRMRNPSIGVWHVEGCPPEIRTVAAALAWRNGTDIPPSVLK